MSSSPPPRMGRRTETHSSLGGKEMKAKMGFLEASLQQEENRVEFLKELYDSGHTREAFLLCCCYIEGLGFSLYWPDSIISERPTFYFVKVLKDFGGEEVLWHVLPWTLLEAQRSPREGKRAGPILAEIESELSNAKGEFYKEDDILRLVAPCLSSKDLEWLRERLWQATLAAFAYREIRSKFVHCLEAPFEAINLTTKFKDMTLDPIDFSTFHRCLVRIMAVVRERTVRSGMWCGHDFKPAKPTSQRTNNRDDSWTNLI